MLEILNKEAATDTDYIGLSEEEANVRQKEGKNLIASKSKSSALKIFSNQFKDFLVIVLLCATLISIVLGEVYDALTIIIIVMLNAVLGFVQEFRTERTLAALNKMTAPKARVFRDGVIKTIDAENIVKGDVFKIEEGDKVPADAVVLSANSLFCDESILTGESSSVIKREYENEPDTDSLNLPYMVYMGCIVTRGNAVCKTVSIGKQTQTGKLSRMIENIEEEKTPLQKRLQSLGKTLAIICMAACVLVAAAGIIRGEDPFSMLMTGLTVAIAAIPEGLPATVTIALALAVRRILKKGAIVNKLHSVETLGSATVICTDKTGTLTENKMTVTEISTYKNEYKVSGTGYSQSGEITSDGKKVRLEKKPDLAYLLDCAVVCNNASIARAAVAKERNRDKSARVWNASGDSAESALLIMAAKAGIYKETIDYKRINEIPFDAKTRMMTVFAENEEGQFAFTKGSIEVVLALCTKVYDGYELVPLTMQMKKEILSKGEEIAKRGMRVLAFSKALGKDIIFLGTVGMLDNLRENIPSAVSLCKRGGIRVLMLTGDHKLTACEVARSAGILNHESEAITGDEIDKLSDDELMDVLESKTVFARVTPEHKLRIVKSLKSVGENVAMTGDGVNDAPAVKEATIGIAMGENGTDVTKEAADLILLDDNFETIVDAVKEGRGIYTNIRKFVRYLISCNIGEVVTMLFGILIGLPPVLLPTQILLVNLATDGLPAIALGLEPTEDEVMKQKPRNENNFFSDGLLSKIIFRGIFIGLCTLGAFTSVLKLSGSVDIARTAALFTLVLSQLIHSFECKSETKSVFQVKFLNNPFLIISGVISFLVLILCITVPFLSVVFNTFSLNATQLVICIIFSCAPAFIFAAVDKIK